MLWSARTLRPATVMRHLRPTRTSSAAAAGRPVQYVGGFAEAASAVAGVARPGEMVLTLGAGSVSHLGPAILEQLQGRAGANASNK